MPCLMVAAPADYLGEIYRRDNRGRLLATVRSIVEELRASQFLAGLSHASARRI